MTRLQKLEQLTTIRVELVRTVIKKEKYRRTQRRDEKDEESIIGD